ncbi:hypothetical protein [Jannaschia donghaensis]|nr:hypothetical protein [Jannaschia donghaensis]
MGRDYLTAGRNLSERRDRDAISLSSNAPIDHLFCHAAELFMKAALIATVPTINVMKYGHRLHCLFGRMEEVNDLGSVLKSTKRAMNQRLGKIERAFTSADEAARFLAEQETFEKMGGAPLPTVGKDAAIMPRELFHWYGLRHSQKGGFFRYPMHRHETVPVVEGKDGLVELLPLALRYWTEEFSDGVYQMCSRASTSPN